MTTYFVDPVNGVDSNNGTAAATAFKTLGFAYAISSVADTINVIASDAAPLNEGLTVAKNVTIQGYTTRNYDPLLDLRNGRTGQIDNSGCRAHIVGGRIVSHGLAKGNLLDNATCEAWTDATADASVMYGWTKSAGGGVNRGTGRGGLYSLQIAAATATVDHTRQVDVYPNRTYRLEFYHKESSAADYRVKYALTHISTAGATTYFTQGASEAAAGTWGAGGASNYGWNDANTGSVASTSFVRTHQDFTVPSEGRLTISIISPSATRTYNIDDLSLIDVTDPTYTWVNYSGNVWYLPLVNNALYTPDLVFYNQSGISASTWRPMHKQVPIQTVGAVDTTTVAEVVANSLSRFYDATTQRLYVNFGDLDITQIGVAIAPSTVYGINATSPCTINDIYTAACHNGLRTATGATSATVFNRCAGNSSYQGHSAVGGTGLFNDCELAYNEENGMGSDVTGTKPVYVRTVAHHNGDDGFQSTAVTSAASFVAINCIAHSNGWGSKTANDGFSNEGTNTGMELYGCTSYGNLNIGINADFSGTGTVIVKNCVSHGNNVNNAGGYTDFKVVGQATTANCSNNCIGELDTQSNLYADSAASPASGYYPTHASFGNKIADPLLANPAGYDFSLSTGSPCYRSGVYNSSMKTDVRGRRRQVPPSIGAYEPSSGDACPIARTSRP
jgi:hypothetical protein